MKNARHSHQSFRRYIINSLHHCFGAALLIMCLLLSLSACGPSEPQLRPLDSNDVIVAFGDSLTFGTGASPSESYPAELAILIHRQVINAGVPGEETSGGLARIDSILTQYHPKLVILCLGGNDQIRRRRPETIEANLREIIHRIKLSGADVILLAVPLPKLNLEVPEYYARLGDEFDIPVAENALSDLLLQPDLKSDYIHLNAKGYRALADSITRRLHQAGALP